MIVTSTCPQRPHNLIREMREEKRGGREEEERGEEQKRKNVVNVIMVNVIM